MREGMALLYFNSLGLLACVWAVVAQGAQPASKVEPEKVRQSIQRALTAKGGLVPMSAIPQGGPASWCYKQYEAAAKFKDVRLTYRLLNSHLQRASQLLASDNANNHAMGFVPATLIGQSPFLTWVPPNP
jgi:hypothetical protein